nr:META domain-containing protein [uncultured Psychrobacter sp.]
MTLSRIFLSIVLGILSAAPLAGCQNSVDVPNAISSIANLSSLMDQTQPSAEVIAIQKLKIIGPLPPKPSYLQPSYTTLNSYLWQLIEVVDEQGTRTPIEVDPHLFMEVRPNNLVFYNDCRHYLFRFSDDSAGDFPYRISNDFSLLNSCYEYKDADNYKFNNNNADLVQSGLKNTLIYTSRDGFGFKLLSATPNVATLDLRIDGGKTLLWQGHIKPIAPTNTLSVTYEFLQSYKWRLVSAVNNEQQPITELNYDDILVNARFFNLSYDDKHYAGFSTGCNGVGGPYILTHDNILLIGSGSQTMMGCNPNREAAEDKIKALELSSRSQLSLNKYSNADKGSGGNSLYLLTQKLDTGETLIWKNEIEKLR